jgi:hypothetical protein
VTIATSATSQNCIKKNTWSSSASTTHEQSPGDPSFQPSSLSYPIAASAEYPIAAVVYALCVSFCVCVREWECAPVWLRESFVCRCVFYGIAERCDGSVRRSCDAKPKLLLISIFLFFGSQSDHEILGELRNTTRSSNSLTSFFSFILSFWALLFTSWSFQYYSLDLSSISRSRDECLFGLK